jgi:hypothetical protein
MSRNGEASLRAVALMLATSAAAMTAVHAGENDQNSDHQTTIKLVATQPACSCEEASSETVSAAGVDWHTDYATAYRAAKQNKRMLLVNVVGSNNNREQRGIEQYIAKYPSMKTRLERVERLRVPANATLTIKGKPQRLLSHPAFSDLQGGPGFALIDLQHVGKPYYGQVVNLLPFTSGKYYHWREDYLATALDLPPGSVTQRTMIWAVRIHPERPASTFGSFHPTLANGAAYQSSYQANIGVQGHHNFETRYAGLAVTGGEVSEVVAESWPGENMIDSCIDCVDSWRHSPGHWNGVVHRHRAFGYDIRRGRNGIWYGTGIFSD